MATGCIEVAALELVNDLPTGRHFHALIHPERDIPEDATRIHGFTLADLAGKPRFAEIVDDLLAFFGDAKLIAHNAPFDFAFLDAEFGRLGRPGLSADAHDRHAGAWRRPGFPACRTASMRYAGGSPSISARARPTTRCWTAGCWPMSMWSSPGAASADCRWPREKAAVELVVYTHTGRPHAAAYRAERGRTRRSRGLRRAAEGSGLVAA